MIINLVSNNLFYTPIVKESPFLKEPLPVNKNDWTIKKKVILKQSALSFSTTAKTICLLQNDSLEYPQQIINQMVHGEHLIMDWGEWRQNYHNSQTQLNINTN